MRKFLAIPLFLVYFLAITGVVVHHTCCIRQDKKAAMACGMEAPMKCCTNHEPKQEDQRNSQSPKDCDQNVQLVKVQSDQFCEKFVQTELISLQQPALPKLNFNCFSEYCWGTLQKTHLPNAPPGFWGNIPIYKLQQRFVLYG